MMNRLAIIVLVVAALAAPSTARAAPFLVGGFSMSSVGAGPGLTPSVALYGLTGEIKDFTFSGAAQTHYPVPPIVGFEFISSPVFSFDLLSVGGPVPSSNLLTLTGSGIFHLVGFADTPGTFSANQAGGTLSFSASQAATAVPEPGSLTLLGLGLFGLAVAIRGRIPR